LWPLLLPKMADANINPGSWLGIATQNWH
jgi:hypothetical protein